MPNIPRSNKRPWQPQRIAFETATNNPFYHTNAWRKFRKAYLQANPLCRVCEERGLIETATSVDHINSINPVNGWDTEDGKYPNPLDADNCQGLCFKCHASKSGKTRRTL